MVNQIYDTGNMEIRTHISKIVTYKNFSVYFNLVNVYKTLNKIQY